MRDRLTKLFHNLVHFLFKIPNSRRQRPDVSGGAVETYPAGLTVVYLAALLPQHCLSRYG